MIIDFAVLIVAMATMFVLGALWATPAAHEAGRKQGWLEGETAAHALNDHKCFEKWEWTK